nr:unnamed protein product [Digitaria exilis]
MAGLGAGLGASPAAAFEASRFRPLASPLRPVRSGKLIVPKRYFSVSSRLAWVEDELMEIRKSQEQNTVKSKKRPPLRRGKVSPQLPVPEHIPRPSYVGSKGLPELCKGQLHDAQGIAGIRAACKLAARVLDFAGTLVKNGDIINIDVNVFLNAAEECLEKGISVCRDGVNYRKIGKKISKLAYFYGYYVVERFVGHGIGTVYHSEPLILHYGEYLFLISNENSGRMVEGQIFTIEPILTMEKTECVTWEDGWTTVTADGSWAAQFEHTILVTRNGAEILTKP